MMTSSPVLSHTRSLLDSHDLFALLVPHTDPHVSEYLASYWQVMPWLTGFSGSAGNVVISRDFAGVWTDSRYFIQAEEQLKDGPFELMKLKIPHTPEYLEWLVSNAPVGSKIGVDGRLLSLSQYRRIQQTFKKGHLELVDIGDPFTESWTDRPALPTDPIVEHGLEIAGKSRAEKLQAVRDEMQQKGATHHLVASLDDIAWLLNLRGADVTYNPVFMSYLLIKPEGGSLFVEETKLASELINELTTAGIEIKPYEAIVSALGTLEEGDSLLIDPVRTNWALTRSVADSVKKIEATNPSTYHKSLKTEVEAMNIRKAMVKDGVAMTRFFYWLEKAAASGDQTEYTLGHQLEVFRAEQEGFQGPSFSPIVGYQGNGAIVHYSAQEDTAATIQQSGILLIDSGGQYLEGTTDITRTIALGPPSQVQKRDFTLVLKGMIGLTTAVFPEGTTGVQLDILARRPLWQQQLNYGHGTGHGVGYFLNVHEGPQRISPSVSAKETIKPGMLTSNEPGIYHTDAYGIRIENLVLCVEIGVNEPFGKFLGFETVTLCPIDVRLIDRALLTDEERHWLNAYHQRVYEALSPHLESNEKIWLAEKTEAL